MSLPRVGGRRRNGQARNPCGGMARPAPTPAVLRKAGCRTAGCPAPEAVVFEPLSTVMPPSQRQPSSAFVRATVSYVMPRVTIVRCASHPTLRLPPVGSECASHCSPRSQSRPSHNFPPMRANPPSSAVMRAWPFPPRPPRPNSTGRGWNGEDGTEAPATAPPPRARQRRVRPCPASATSPCGRRRCATGSARRRSGRTGISRTAAFGVPVPRGPACGKAAGLPSLAQGRERRRQGSRAARNALRPAARGPGPAQRRRHPRRSSCRRA